MDNIQYDPEQILNGLPEDVLKELAKKLKRRIRMTKNEIIQEILSPPKGKPDARVKVWQEINWQLRKELETFTEEVSTMFSSTDVSIEEQFKVGYMFTLSSNPEIRAMGEELYCQAEKNKELNKGLDKEDALALITEITEAVEASEAEEMIEASEAEEMIEASEAEEMIEASEAEEMIEVSEAVEMIEAREVEETVETREAVETVEAREVEEMVEAREAKETVEAREAAETVEAREAAESVEAREAEETVEAREAEEMVEAIEAVETVEAIEAVETVEARESAETVEARESEEMVEARESEEMVEAIEAADTVEAREAEEMIEAREVEEMIEVREAESMIDAREAETMLQVASGSMMPSNEQVTEETEELQKRIRTLENKLRKAIAEGLRTKGQFEKLKIDMVALKSQWVREKEETGKYRNRVRELEGERVEKEKEIDGLKQKLEQRKTLAPQRTKEQPQRRELQKVKGESGGEIDLASYQGRKALIFADRDNEVDNRLNALGIIPIWAMEIDWNRPRRRMSTCEIVLYKMNDKKLKKLDEIRDIARYWNIPCNELLNI